MEQTKPRPLVSGAPCSGFSILISVCNSVLNRTYADAAMDLREMMVRELVDFSGLYLRDQYFKTFHGLGLANDLVFNGEFHRLVGGPKWLDPEDPTLACVRKYVGLRGKGDFLLVTRHPREALEYNQVLHSHERPKLWLTTPYYDRFIKLASIRNPIGIINSACFSLNAMASEYLQRFAPNFQEDEVRQRHGAYKLTDLEFVQGLLKYLVRYLDEFLAVRDRYWVMRWEELIGQPGPTIQGVARAIGIALDLDQARAIWQPLDHKNLMEFHKHNYRRGKGIVGDWKNSLVAEHMELFRQFGFDRYLVELGYPPIPELAPRDYSPFQKLVARMIQRGETYNNVGDRTLFDLAFNKTNIDSTKFNFRSLPRKQWTQVERTTLADDAIAERVSKAVEDDCQRVNELLSVGLRIDFRDPGQIQRAVQQVTRLGHGLLPGFISPEGQEAFRRLSGRLAQAMQQVANQTPRPQPVPTGATSPAMMG